MGRKVQELRNLCDNRWIMTSSHSWFTELFPFSSININGQLKWLESQIPFRVVAHLLNAGVVEAVETNILKSTSIIIITASFFFFHVWLWTPLPDHVSNRVIFGDLHYIILTWLQGILINDMLLKKNITDLLLTYYGLVATLHTEN